ncbi:MAG: hypothetical protein LBH29_02965 [Elusimicrobiota bacterium]|nr:hypothetical protein [Elusimicrobiota bacterium]
MRVKEKGSLETVSSEVMSSRCHCGGRKRIALRKHIALTESILTHIVFHLFCRCLKIKKTKSKKS